MNPETVLFALLRAAVCGEEISEPVKEACTPDVLEQVYILAQKHDLAHLPGHVLGNLGLPDSEPLGKLKKAAFMAVYRYEQLNRELERICKTLENAKIRFVPLKGSVIRRLYPEPWMRTSCDIDILIHEEDLEKTVDILAGELSYTTDHKKHYHDVSLFSKNGVHLELHFSIQETMENIDRLLSRAWDFAYPVTAYRFAFQNEFLLFHLIAHMSYHFTGGGCGIRPFLDIFLVRKSRMHQEAVVRGYLAECGLEKFYDSVLSLIDVWFEGKEHSEITKAMQAYLLTGGVYGNEEQRIAVQLERKGGKFGYLLRRIFLPHRDLKIRYRILEKYPLLHPFFQIKRWTELLFGKRLARCVQELQTSTRTQKAQSQKMNAFLRDVGL